MRTFFVLYFLLALSSPGSACSCLGNPLSFDLLEFDRSYDVVEVTILDARRVNQSEEVYLRMRLTYDSLIAVYDARDDRTMPPPPPPPPPPSTQGIATAKVYRAYKGRIQSDTIQLLGGYDGAACEWLPATGGRYLIYLATPSEFRQQLVYGVSACQRKLSLEYGGERFSQERAILTSLADADSGPCEPVEELNHVTGEVGFRPFTGDFADGLRDGVWSVNLPLMWWRDTLAISERPALRIVYEHGLIVGVEPDRATLQLATHRSHKFWIGRYHEFLRKKPED